jgi:TetR/AcrR family transcriptional repressor of nem operon
MTVCIGRTSSFGRFKLTYDAVCELAVSHTIPYVKAVAASKTREETKRETREALIDAGIALFGEEGLDASLDAICARAGFTRGAFYVHFADRDVFLEAVMGKVGAQFLDAVLGATGEDENILGVAGRFLRAVASGDYPLMRPERGGGVRPHQLLDACARSPAVRARYVALAEDSVGRMAKAVRRGQKDQVLRADVDAKVVAQILLAAIIGAQTMYELAMPIDLAKTSALLLRVLAPPVGR